MNRLTEVIGILLCVQGFGGAVNAVVDGGRGWFLVRHVLPEGAQVPVAVAVALLGVLILVSRGRRREDA